MKQIKIPVPEGLITSEGVIHEVILKEPTYDDVMALGEPTQFLCDISECIEADTQELWFTCEDGRCDDTPLESYESTALSDDGDEVSDETVWKYWIVKVGSLGESWFTVDDSQCDWDPLEGFTIASDLECEFRRYAPPHTVLIFDYSALS